MRKEDRELKARTNQLIAIFVTILKNAKGD